MELYISYHYSSLTSLRFTFEQTFIEYSLPTQSLYEYDSAVYM